MPDRRNTKIGRNDPCPCGSGRKHKKCCAGKARDAGTPTQAEVLAQSEIRITQEIDHIVGRAMEGSGSVVRLGQLVLFSTASGDAWLLDPEQGTALPLARAGERLPARVLETDERFVIEWTHDYQVHGQWFDAVERASGAREVFTGYPTAQLVVD